MSLKNDLSLLADEDDEELMSTQKDQEDMLLMFDNDFYQRN